MNKAKAVLLVTFLIIFSLSACGKRQEPKDNKDNTTKTENAKSETDEKETPESLHGLIEDEYANLEITAEVLQRMAILPGSTIPLSVSITNNGDQKIIYTQGSGSFEIPEALVLDISKLQAILPKDHLGVATMDIRSGELLPGETLNYTLNIRAIEPTENFNDYTYSKWNDGNEYIADIDWETLSGEYSDLTAAKADTYEGHVYFLYALENEQGNPTLSPTGYSGKKFTVTITK